MPAVDVRKFEPEPQIVRQQGKPWDSPQDVPFASF